MVETAGTMEGLHQVYPRGDAVDKSTVESVVRADVLLGLLLITLQYHRHTRARY